LDTVDGIEAWLATDAWLEWLPCEDTSTRDGREAKDGTEACDATDCKLADDGWLVTVWVTEKKVPWAMVCSPRPTELLSSEWTCNEVSELRRSRR